MQYVSRSVSLHRSLRGKVGMALNAAASSIETELSTFDTNLELDSRPLLGGFNGRDVRSEAVFPDSSDNREMEFSPRSQRRLGIDNPIRRFTLVVSACLLLGVFLVQLQSGRWLTATTSDTRGSTVKSCQDPYTKPGYLNRYRLHKGPRMRFLPFKAAAISLQDNHTDDGLVALKDDIPAYSTLIADEPDLSSVESLKRLRGKNVLLLGCSTDRNAVKSFSKTHRKAGQLNIKHHRWAYCKVPTLDNLTLQSFFHFGMHQDQRFKGQDREGKATTFEDRFRHIYRRLMMPKAGEPDLIILSSGEWDYDFLRYKERIASGSTPKDALKTFGKIRKSQLALFEAQWYRKRLHEVIRFLRSEFPKKPIMWRTVGPYSGGSSRNQFIFQLNQAAMSVMDELDVPVFPWSEYLAGTTEYGRYADGRTDSLHFRTGSRPDWLFGEMVLYYLAEHTKTDKRGLHCP